MEYKQASTSIAFSCCSVMCIMCIMCIWYLLLFIYSLYLILSERRRHISAE